MIDALEALAGRLVAGLDDTGWQPEKAQAVAAGVLGEAPPSVVAVLEFAAREVVPRLERTPDEVANVLRALDGRYVPAGPSGSPTRGLVNVLPTGRNFYSVDPKAIPSRNAWDVGAALAESLVARHLADTGSYPRSVGLTVWGTSAMRTQGDDIAEVLALIGCRPVWDDASRRVTGFEVTPLAELGRPRIDVTVRISGFFRDAFPHVIALLDDAIAAVADLDEPAESNYLRAHAEADTAAHGDRRRATTRIFGSKPGAYGAGLLPLIDARNWRTDADLAEVYAVWGGYAYGRGLDGREARADMESAFRRIAVAAKNTDTREHDIADSDDYFQFHGGMVAMVRHLTGDSPAAYIGDSALPDLVRTRTLAEETRRVFRSRVVNPRWLAAMARHGYKGAFEMAATVDYLFGYDATAGVVDDWMYEQLAASYVFDSADQRVHAQVEPVGAARHRRAAAGGRRPRAVGRARGRHPGGAAVGVPGTGRRTGGEDRDRTSAPPFVALWQHQVSRLWQHDRGDDMNGFPFSAVVGMDELRLGLVLNAVSPGIGGVLVRGEKGTAKSTMVRALAAILPDVAGRGRVPVLLRPGRARSVLPGRAPRAGSGVGYPRPRGWSSCRSGPARTGWSARWTSNGR